MKIWILFISLGILGGYTAIKANAFIEGPVIIIEAPSLISQVNTSMIEIEGRADRISYLTLNDTKIFTDESGLFKEQVLLSPGYNVITIKAQDRFERTVTQTLEITYNK